MKNVIFLFLVVLFGHNILAVQLLQFEPVAQGKVDAVRIDSVLNSYFTFLYNTVDNREKMDLAKITELDSLGDKAEVENEITYRLEQLTGIKAKHAYYYASGKSIERGLVDKWKSWCEKNRELLVWNEEKKRIERSDYDIDTGRKIPRKSN